MCTQRLVSDDPPLVSQKVVDYNMLRAEHNRETSEAACAARARRFWVSCSQCTLRRAALPVSQEARLPSIDVREAASHAPRRLLLAPEVERAQPRETRRLQLNKSAHLTEHPLGVLEDGGMGGEGVDHEACVAHAPRHPLHAVGRREGVKEAGDEENGAADL